MRNFYIQKKKNVEVDIIPASGKSLRKYSFEGKTFIEGKKGSEFSIRIHNPNNFRVEVVVSVDGLSVVDGKKANSNSGSYIIDAFDTYRIEGWRISNEKIRKFFFTEKEKSYSAKKDGEDENCGVISVLAFAEKEKEVFDYLINYTLPQIGWEDPNKYFKNNIFYNSSGTFNLGEYQTINSTSSYGVSNLKNKKSSITQDSFDLGVGMGKKTESHVVSVDFKRGVFLGKTTFYYASRSSLIDLGIDVEKKPKVRLPQAFTDFCEEI